MCWLEDSHIRRLPVASREDLRTANFHEALARYLELLDVAEAEDDLLPTIAALTDIALNLNYNDSAPIYNTPIDPWKGNSIATADGCANDAQVMDEVVKMLQTVGIDKIPDSTEEGLAVIEDLTDAISRGMDKVYLDVNEVPAGLPTNDSEVDTFARITRILQLQKLRDLQDDINDVIAHMQSITADPKTDVRRGKVGR